MSKLSIRLVAARKSRRLSQAQLAQKLGVTKQTISNYENEIRTPDLEMLENLAAALDTTVGFLIGSTDDPEKLPPYEYTEQDLSDDDLLRLRLSKIGEALAPKRSKQWRIISEGMSTFEAEDNPAFQALFQYLVTAYPNYFAERNDDDANDPES